MVSSSVDPTQVSTTVSGIIMSLASIVTLFAAQGLGIHMVAGDVNTLAAEVGAAAGAIATLYGLGRKVLVYFATREKVVA